MINGIMAPVNRPIPIHIPPKCIELIFEIMVFFIHFSSFLHFGWLPICLSASFLPSLSIFSSLGMASHDPTPRLTYHAGRILYSLSPHSPHNASPRGSPHHIYAKQGHPFGNAPTIIAYSAYLLHLFS